MVIGAGGTRKQRAKILIPGGVGIGLSKSSPGSAESSRGHCLAIGEQQMPYDPQLFYWESRKMSFSLWPPWVRVWAEHLWNAVT